MAKVIVELFDYSQNAIEAQCLVNQLQLFYASEDPRKTELLEAFINCPDSFKYSDLIAEIQKSVVQ